MRRPIVLLLSLAVLVAAGCRSSNQDAAPATTLETSTTMRPTTSTTVQPTTTGVPRTTVTTLVTMGPGDASLGGTVSGPSGPVDGATVRVERMVGGSVATADVTTAGGGGWHVPSILGGSYRVRAFKSPDLAQSQVEAFFLAANERKTVDFKLNAVGGERITAVVNPSPPRVDQQATLTITVGTGRVDDQGRTTITPRPGVPLSVAPPPGILLESPPEAVTDASGSAVWRIRCAAEGASTVSLTVTNTVGVGVTEVSLPPCAPPGATPATRPG